jgi:hypothetical protein
MEDVLPLLCNPHYDGDGPADDTGLSDVPLPRLRTDLQRADGHAELFAYVMTAPGSPPP